MPWWAWLLVGMSVLASIGMGVGLFAILAVASEAARQEAEEYQHWMNR